METSVFFAAPDRRSQERVKKQLSGRTFSWAYLGQDIAKFNLARQNFEGLSTQIDSSQRFHQAANALRQPYLEYLYDIGRQNNSLDWWLTSLSYRSGYVSKTFHRACYLQVALDLAKTWDQSEPLVIVVADAPVRRALELNLPKDIGHESQVIGFRHNPGFLSGFQWLKDAMSMLVHRAFFLKREGSRLLQARRTVRRLEVPSEPTTLIFSSVHSGNVSRGGDFHAASFGDLSVQLEKLGHRVAITPIVLRDLPYREALNRIRNGSNTLLVPARYLRFRDLMGAVLSSCGKPPVGQPLKPLAGMDINPLVKEELRVHQISNATTDALLIVALIRRWAGMGASFSRIIYRYENQPWERALCWAARRYLPDTELVGHQHTRVPRLFLNFHLVPGEESVAPLPDRVVTMGRYTARLMSSAGYGAERIRAGGVLHIPSRNGKISRAAAPSTPGINAPVLVAPSNGLEEATELVDTASRLFDEEKGVPLIVKCHPTMPFQKFQGLMRGPLPKHARVSEESITDLIPKSSIMLYTGSMVCVQALAARLPVVHLRPQFDLDMDPLEAAPDARLEAAGLEELRRKVRWLLSHREEYIENQRENWSRLVDEIYTPPTEETYRAFID